MATFSDAVIDGGLDFFAGAGSPVTRVDIVKGTEPGTYAAATGSNSVGNYTIDNTDFTKGNGDVSGRKVTLGAQTGSNGTNGGGAANWLAFTNGTDTLYATIAADADTVNAGSPVDISATDVWEIADPA